ncbi:hypothetical protein RF11_08177 [Thelohanellus kitauei]|uniref:Uncharacterized protein n=1 Tax=Thelohanellus kitauei TaxID=669202 RepID=A0A0C2JWI0_THEKT|nr:hypothetical protein RF11_08177 [Thelohanellus kitauei]
MIEAIKSLLRSRYQEIEFFDVNYLSSNDPVKLLTVIKLCVDNYIKIKDAHEQLKISMADPRVVIDQHEILIEDIIKHEADIEELIHESQNVHTVRQFSRSFNDILDWLVQNLRRILPESSLNIELVNKINLIKQNHNTSTGEILYLLSKTIESQEVYFRKLEKVLYSSINSVLTYILFDPFKKPLSIPPEYYNMSHIDMGLEMDAFLTEIEHGINAFLLKLQKDGRFKFAEYLKKHFDLNLNLQSEYDEISEGVDRLFSITHCKQFKCDTLMEKLQIIENHVLDPNLDDIEIKADTELEVFQEDFNKYINLAIEKLSVARQKCALISDLDSDTIETINTFVTSFTSILLDFSRTPFEIGDSANKIDKECSEFIKNINNSITSFSNHFKQLKETVERLEEKHFKNMAEIEEIRTEQSIMFNKIKEVEGEIQTELLDHEHNASVVETTKNVSQVRKTFMKYFTDLMNEGIKMRLARGEHKNLSSTDGDLDSDNLNVDDMTKHDDKYLDEIPDSVLDEQLEIKEA